MNLDETNNIIQLLTFNLNEEFFGINVIQVQEILSNQKITKIPRTPEYMEGIINVRGSIVPVIDLRKKFDLELKEDTIDTSIVVLEVENGDEVIVIGIIVDSVQEVNSFDTDNIKNVPNIGMSVQENFIEGIGKKDDDFIIILNTNTIFNSEEITNFNETSLV